MTQERDPEVLITGVQPSYAHPGDAGADLRASSAHTLAPGERALIPTGTSIALPHGFVGLVMPRSGLALRHGIGLVNSPGVIDAGYRGEIAVLLINHDPVVSFSIEPGDRIAQLLISPVARAHFQPVSALPGSQRDMGGFGSTGINEDGEHA
jgi:dUTP pyrophosphatase